EVALASSTIVVRPGSNGIAPGAICVHGRLQPRFTSSPDPSPVDHRAGRPYAVTMRTHPGRPDTTDLGLPPRGHVRSVEPPAGSPTAPHAPTGPPPGSSAHRRHHLPDTRRVFHVKRTDLRTQRSHEGFRWCGAPFTPHRVAVTCASKRGHVEVPVADHAARG